MNIWDEGLKSRSSPYFDMKVWDNSLTNGYIHFNSKELGVDSLGYIVENDNIQIRLQHELMKRKDVKMMYETNVEKIQLPKENLETKINNLAVITTNKGIFFTKLLVGADGANSFIRNEVGIPTTGFSYNQMVIIIKLLLLILLLLLIYFYY